MKKVLAELGMALFMGLMAVAFVGGAVVGCTSLGVVAPKSFEQDLAYGYGSVTAMRTSAAQALAVGTITVADAQHVLEVTDNAKVLLDTARTTQLTSPLTAQQTLVNATALLTALQSYLVAKGVK